MLNPSEKANGKVGHFYCLQHVNSARDWLSPSPENEHLPSEKGCKFVADTLYFLSTTKEFSPLQPWIYLQIAFTI